MHALARSGASRASRLLLTARTGRIALSSSSSLQQSQNQRAFTNTARRESQPEETEGADQQSQQQQSQPEKSEEGEDPSILASRERLRRMYGPFGRPLTLEDRPEARAPEPPIEEVLYRLRRRGIRPFEPRPSLEERKLEIRTQGGLPFEPIKTQSMMKYELIDEMRQGPKAAAAPGRRGPRTVQDMEDMFKAKAERAARLARRAVLKETHAAKKADKKREKATEEAKNVRVVEEEDDGLERTPGFIDKNYRSYGIVRYHTTLSGEGPTPAPKGWEKMWEVLKEMRAPGGAASNAPVDTIGCERLAEPNVLPREQRFQTLVGLMLSSQTKDIFTSTAMYRLQTLLQPHKEGAAKGLTIDNVIAADDEHLVDLIGGVGFPLRKTGYLKETAKICRDKHGGDIPDTIEGLLALPGVGPKMAYLCMSSAWGREEGIGVDTHVFRITKRWGWYGIYPTKSPEDARKRLQDWLPRDKWREVNTLVVGLGQTICTAASPKCGRCELGLQGLCRDADPALVADALAWRKKCKEEEIEGSAENEVAEVKPDFRMLFQNTRYDLRSRN